MQVPGHRHACSAAPRSKPPPVDPLGSSARKKKPLGKLTNKNKIKIRKGRIEIEKRGGN